MAVATSFRHAGASDPGRKRGNNEDRYFCDPAHGIYAVVDGMGGQAAGEQAAEIAVNMLGARLERPTGATADRIREAIAVANNEIYEAARANPEWQGMACVLTVAVIENGRATIGHVGDTRLYLLTPGQIRKITHDHSPIGEREDGGELSEGEAMRHPRRNEVYRDVGSSLHRPDDRDFIEIAEVSLAPDCALLLASDGLTDLVPSAEIRRIVEQHAGDPAAAVRALIAAANAAGGKDNITAVVVAGPDYGPAKAPATKAAATPPSQSAASPIAGRWAFLLYGALLGLLLMWALGPWLESLGQPAAPAANAPRTWTVGPTPESDGATISTVLEKAKFGDTVVVAPGEYRELVRMRDGVNLVSREPHGAVLRASGRGIAVLAEDVPTGRVTGFRIAGEDRFPMAVGVQVRNSAVRLEHLEISGATSAGIEILGDSAPALESNQVVNNPGSGIVVRDRATPRLEHNVIGANGKAPQPRPGLEIHNAAVPVLTGNVFIDNGAEPIWAPPPGIDAGVLARNFFERGTTRRRVRVIPQ
ncbi:MAG TPA: protein phosphatase 2C domain-containing protein [Bryobacteraceae bacterium]|nr:protein phosphatase 2C domain-containing protein [Bryobacteraceae bacterium]